VADGKSNPISSIKIDLWPILIYTTAVRNRRRDRCCMDILATRIMHDGLVFYMASDDWHKDLEKVKDQALSKSVG